MMRRLALSLMRYGPGSWQATIHSMLPAAAMSASGAARFRPHHCGPVTASLKRAQCMRRQYWPLVPDEYVSRLHFYNTGFDSNTSHAAHPMNIIRAIHNPGDVIVLKLDIDHSELELSIIKEIEDSPVLIRMITEMYLNMKYDHGDMDEVFGLNNSRTLTEVTARFKTLRRAGLILHFWA